MNKRIRLGVSSCLLGQAVRYDGGHKRHDYIVETLGRAFELVPFCPEVAIGLGVPRLPIQLVKIDGGIRARGVIDPALEVTVPLVAYAEQVAREFGDISGYVFKKNSPSCGIDGVPVYTSQGKTDGESAGIYAKALRALLPGLPVIDEDQLADITLREHFLAQVRAYYRLMGLQE